MYSQISILRNHIYLAADFGAPFQELCKRLNIKPEDLNRGEEHFAWEPGKDGDFWLTALELTGIQSLGLQMGQRPTGRAEGRRNGGPSSPKPSQFEHVTALAQ